MDSVAGWISDFFGQIGNIFDDAIEGLVDLLPDSPFIYLTVDSGISEILGYLNYVIPVNYIISLLQFWLTAVIGYYAWQAILRFFKAVE